MFLGPPADNKGNILSPVFDSRGYCSPQCGWVCEHRWREIANMVKFRKIANGARLTNWWDNKNNQIAFGRKNKAFVVINNEKGPLVQTLNTDMPAGSYCNIFEEGENCNGKSPIVVDKDGKIHLHIQTGYTALAIHIEVCKYEIIFIKIL